MDFEAFFASLQEANCPYLSQIKNDQKTWLFEPGQRRFHLFLWFLTTISAASKDMIDNLTPEQKEKEVMNQLQKFGVSDDIATLMGETKQRKQLKMWRNLWLLLTTKEIEITDDLPKMEDMLPPVNFGDRLKCAEKKAKMATTTTKFAVEVSNSPLERQNLQEIETELKEVECNLRNLKLRTTTQQIQPTEELPLFANAEKEKIIKDTTQSFQVVNINFLPFLKNCPSKSEATDFEPVVKMTSEKVVTVAHDALDFNRSEDDDVISSLETILDRVDKMSYDSDVFRAVAEVSQTMSCI